ncbi:MAG: hydroxyacid dehydrogenase [Firmicutes bacterium]|nr:hydroxyacid dehydrogenase [Bacillota bacterium]
MKPRIALLQSHALTKKLFKEEYLERLRQVADVVINSKDENPTSADVEQVLEGASACITSWGCPMLTAEILDKAPDLRLVVHAAGTVKGIVSDAVWERNIIVTSGSPAIAIGVAETALGLTITSLKNIWRLSALTRQGLWRENQAAIDDCRELFEITVGVIGASNVGRHYIKLLRNFEVEILVYDPIWSADKIRELGARKVELDELLMKSDVVSVHAPAIPATRHMLNKDNLRLMKDNAILINTARGSIINEEDLIAELKKGRIWACIDVTDPEPPTKDSALRSLPNVILTPHIAGVVTNGLFRLGRYATEEIERFVAGEAPINPVKKESLSYIA